MKHTLIAIMLAGVCFCGCGDGLDIRQDYDFSLSTWYLQGSIPEGGEVEIRFYLDREGD